MSFRPQITATQHTLPFSQLSWEQFERLCLRLIQARGYSRIEHLGGSGGEEGRDIVAFDGTVKVAVQCKRVEKFSAAHGRREIEKLLALDSGTRPDRLLFIVTCNISSIARENIKKLWSGNPNDCEFLASTELDAEVRAAQSILLEFFNLPQHYERPGRNTGLEGEPNSHRMLARVEAEIQDWMVTTRSIPFQRVRQAIEEIDQPVGRLEANRAFLEAVRTAGAISRVDKRIALKICEELEVHSLFQVNWKLRRMLARVIGDIVGLHLGNHERRLVSAFCEPRLRSSEGQQLLAEAACEHTAAASAIGTDILRGLVLSKQPQVSWQLLRRWPVIAPVLSDTITLEDAFEVRDAGNRRMLLITHLQAARRSEKTLKRHLEAMGSSIGKKNTDVHLYTAVLAWATLNTTVDLRRKTSWPGPFTRIHDLIRVANWSEKGSAETIESIALALELDSIELDLLNADGSYQPHPNERYSEGRYGHTRHYVRLALRAAPSQHVAQLLSGLIGCADEGIRWAVAAELLNWWGLLDGKSVAVSVLRQLVNDEHPWVVREALQQLATDSTLCQSISIDSLVQLAEDSRSNAEENGWPTYELAAAIRRVASFTSISRPSHYVAI